MPAGNEASAGARGRHVVGVAARTYVADQRSSSPAHPAARLLLLLATLAADSRGIFCIPLAVSVDARRPKHQAYASTLSSSWLAAFRHSPRRYTSPFASLPTRGSKTESDSNWSAQLRNPSRSAQVYVRRGRGIREGMDFAFHSTVAL